MAFDICVWLLYFCIFISVWLYVSIYTLCLTDLLHFSTSSIWNVHTFYINSEPVFAHENIYFGSEMKRIFCQPTLTMLLIHLTLGSNCVQYQESLFWFLHYQKTHKKQYHHFPLHCNKTKVIIWHYSCAVFFFFLGIDHIFFYSSQVQNALSKYFSVFFSFKYPRAWDCPFLDFSVPLLFLLNDCYCQCHNFDSHMDRENSLEPNVFTGHFIIHRSGPLHNLRCMLVSSGLMLMKLALGSLWLRCFSNTPSLEWSLQFCWQWPLTAM